MAQGSTDGQNKGRGICPTAYKLLEIYAEAVKESGFLHELQFQAVLGNDPEEAGRFDILIHDANEKKQNAKYAYLSHVDEHGCSPIGPAEAGKKTLTAGNAAG